MDPPLVLELDSIPDLELFGPFLALKPFDDPNQAVQELVSTRYAFCWHSLDASKWRSHPDGSELRHGPRQSGLLLYPTAFAFRRAKKQRLDSGTHRPGVEGARRSFLYSKELVKNRNNATLAAKH